MWFWWFILFCDILIPVIMIIAGRFMWKRPPNRINSLIGYRTSRSMKNEDTWKFAHEHSGKAWWKAGWITLLPSIIVHLPVYGKGENAISTISLILMVVQLVVLIVSILPTERALQNTFNDDGTRK